MSEEIISPKNIRYAWLENYKDENLYDFMSVYFGKENPLGYKKILNKFGFFMRRKGKDDKNIVNACVASEEENTFYVLFEEQGFTPLHVKKNEMFLFSCLFKIEFEPSPFFLSGEYVSSEMIVPSAFYFSKESENLIPEKWKIDS